MIASLHTLFFQFLLSFHQLVIEEPRSLKALFSMLKELLRHAACVPMLFECKCLCRQIGFFVFAGVVLHNVMCFRQIVSSLPCV
jgi:hypothetical protein